MPSRSPTNARSATTPGSPGKTTGLPGMGASSVVYTLWPSMRAAEHRERGRRSLRRKVRMISPVSRRTTVSERAGSLAQQRTLARGGVVVVDERGSPAGLLASHCAAVGPSLSPPGRMATAYSLRGRCRPSGSKKSVVMAGVPLRLPNRRLPRASVVSCHRSLGPVVASPASGIGLVMSTAK